MHSPGAPVVWADHSDPANTGFLLIVLTGEFVLHWLGRLRSERRFCYEHVFNCCHASCALVVHLYCCLHVFGSYCNSMLAVWSTWPSEHDALFFFRSMAVARGLYVQCPKTEALNLLRLSLDGKLGQGWLLIIFPFRPA